jgi:hypothetical protein
MAIYQILVKLRNKHCIVRRGDRKWMGDWDERVIDGTLMTVMEKFGYIELVDRKQCDGTTYPAYVITDTGRDALEKHEEGPNFIKKESVKTQNPS